MKLTLGMATYEDYDGVYFTIQAIRTYHPEVLSELEIIVVDNHPGTKVGEYIQNLIDPSKMGKGFAGSKYIPMPENTGTTQPRNRIFQEASGDAVMCVDSHVLLSPGSLARLIDWYDKNQSKDLYSGPILYDDMSLCGDHFANVWRAEMWGIWGTGWTDKHDNYFTVFNEEGRAVCRTLDMQMAEVEGYESIDYKHHSSILRAMGCTRLVDQDSPYQIPGMGLGLFTCRRDAWLGFNPHFLGFGGEEMYIHEKFRKAGHKAICLPWLKWGHRFGRPHGTPYLEVCTRFNKVRNYILGLRELGLPVRPCWEHFVAGRLVHPKQWEYIWNDPINARATLPPENRVERGSNTLKELSNAN